MTSSLRIAARRMIPERDHRQARRPSQAGPGSPCDISLPLVESSDIRKAQSPLSSEGCEKSVEWGRAPETDSGWVGAGPDDDLDERLAAEDEAAFDRGAPHVM